MEAGGWGGGAKGWVDKDPPEQTGSSEQQLSMGSIVTASHWLSGCWARSSFLLQ